MNKDNYGVFNSLSLAYIGDAIYEVYIRKYLIGKNIVKVKELQESAISYVSARNQAKFLKELIDNSMLTEDELAVAVRARNHKSTHRAKSTDIITYKHATALEAIIGYLYLEKKYDRLNIIMKYILGGEDVSIW